MKEQELFILADPQLRASTYLTAHQLVWLAQAFSAKGDVARTGQALELAVATSSRLSQAWREYIDHLESTNAKTEQWKKVVRDMSAAFKNYPDIMVWVKDVERKMITSQKGSTAVAKDLRREVRKLARGLEGRTDLAVKRIIDQAGTMAEAGDIDVAMDVYKRALKDFGMDVTVFKALSGSYFDLGTRNNLQSEALRNISSAFRRHFVTPSGDFFAMKMHAGLLNFVADFYDEAGDEKKAQRLRKKADRVTKAAQAVGKF